MAHPQKNRLQSQALPGLALAVACVLVVAAPAETWHLTALAASANDLHAPQRTNPNPAPWQAAILAALFTAALSLWNSKPKPPKPDQANPTAPSKEDTIARLQAENESLRKAAEESQAEAQALRVDLAQIRQIQSASLGRFQAMFYELPLPCFTVNEAGHVMEWNHAAASFFSVPEYLAVDQPIAAILGEGIFRNDAEGVIYLVFMGRRPDPVTITITTPTGLTRTVRWFASPVLDQAGRVVGALNTLGILPRPNQQQEAGPGTVAQTG